MRVCSSCAKRFECRAPACFERFQRVYDHLEGHDDLDSLRQRLRGFLQINHCVGEGELDLIHTLPVDHIPEHGISGQSAHFWGISEEQRQRMIAMGRKAG